MSSNTVAMIGWWRENDGLAHGVTRKTGAGVSLQPDPRSVCSVFSTQQIKLCFENHLVAILQDDSCYLSRHGIFAPRISY